MEAGYTKSGSANIYYEFRGDKNKKLLILLHGNGKSMESFNKLAPLLEPHFRLLLVDSRGHGKSEFGRAELTLGASVIDIENLIEELNLKKVNIFGFGDGANIALLFAIKCPDMVESIILSGANYNFSGYSLVNRILLKLAYVCSKISGVFDAHNRLNKEYFSLIVKEPKLKKSTLSSVKANTLVLAATKDMIKLSHSKNMASSIKNADIKIVDGDRFWVFRQPQKAANIIIKYLNKF